MTPPTQTTQKHEPSMRQNLRIVESRLERFTFIVHCIFSPFQLSGLLLFQDELQCGVAVLLLRGGGGGSGGGASGSHSENIVNMRA